MGGQMIFEKIEKDPLGPPYVFAQNFRKNIRGTKINFSVINLDDKESLLI
jgi:hypothetical protein